jgi:hypothetical protein
LQVRDRHDFRDVEVVETDPTGRFGFEAHDPGQYRLVFVGPKGFCPATIPVRYSTTGLRGIRLTLPTGPSDTSPQYCERDVNNESYRRTTKDQRRFSCQNELTSRKS